jgi:hypothetical protein
VQAPTKYELVINLRTAKAIEWDCSSLHLLTAAFGTKEPIDVTQQVVGLLRCS